jgi:hypothetical protein
VTPDDYIAHTLEVLGVRIRYAELPEDRDGEYIHRRRLIRLQHGMPARLRRSVLAHECAHAVFEDVPSMFGPVNAKQERRAEEWAALRLLTLTSYKRAEIIHEGHAEAMAVELHVTVDIVEAYRGMLLVVDNFTYLRPKMGAGQWAHRSEIA